MNRGLLIKAFRENWSITLSLGAGMLIIETILAYVLPSFGARISAQLMQLGFIQGILRGLLGMDVAESIGPEMFSAIAWVHPVVLALFWAHAIVICTRVPAGEVDRGTVDVLLGLPVSRWGLFVSETLAWLVGIVLILLLGIAGNLLGTRWLGAHQNLRQMLIVTANLLCLCAAVAGVSWLASALSDRRGRAIGAAFAIVLASFLLNYLSQFWEPARRALFLSILRYYRPLFILRDNRWPIADIVALTSTAIALWLMAGVVFSRRDLSTT